MGCISSCVFYPQETVEKCSPGGGSEAGCLCAGVPQEGKKRSFFRVLMRYQMSFQRVALGSAEPVNHIACLHADLEPTCLIHACVQAGGIQGEKETRRKKCKRGEVQEVSRLGVRKTRQLLAGLGSYIMSGVPVNNGEASRGEKKILHNIILIHQIACFRTPKKGIKSGKRQVFLSEEELGPC